MIDTNRNIKKQFCLFRSQFMNKKVDVIAIAPNMTI